MKPDAGLDFSQDIAWPSGQAISEKEANMMRHSLLKVLGGLTACCVMVLLAAPSVSAQRRWPFGRFFDRAEAQRLIQRAEYRSAAFTALWDRALDESSLQGTFREDRLNQRASNLQRELDMVRTAIDNNYGRYEVTAYLSRAIDIATPINNVVRRRNMDFEAERQWALLRSDLNRLAAIYDIRQLPY
jgi:hypothetical protein